MTTRGFGTGLGGGGRFRAPGVGGRGRQPGGFGLGPRGECVCPKCGTKATHSIGQPCNQMSCPSCGTAMTRKQ